MSAPQPVNDPPPTTQTFNDVYFRILYIPLLVTLLVLLFIFVLMSTPSSIDARQSFIGGGLINFNKLFS